MSDDRQPTACPWVRVEDEMPPEEVPVWLHGPSGTWIGCRTYVVDQGWFWADCGVPSIKDGHWVADVADIDDYVATHWMPLPTLPAADNARNNRDAEVDMEKQNTAATASPVDCIFRCPFCGSEQITQRDCRMMCESCTAMGPPALTTTDLRIVASKWNQRFDGRYGITAFELEQQIVDRLRNWAEHFAPDNHYVKDLLQTVERRPLTQTVTGILNQFL